MGRVIEFRIPKHYQRQQALFLRGHKAKVLQFKRPTRKFPPDDWHILGLTLGELMRMDTPHLR